nr:peroxidase 25 [Tanacetum cinerariifolium]
MATGIVRMGHQELSIRYSDLAETECALVLEKFHHAKQQQLREKLKKNEITLWTPKRRFSPATGLKSGFYSSICPTAEATVRSVVETHFKDDHTVAATLLRLHFHDCFVEAFDHPDTVYMFRRHYVGEDLEPLSLRELQNVEQQLETALKQTRIRKYGMLKNKSTYEIMSSEDIGLYRSNEVRLTLGKLRGLSFSTISSVGPNKAIIHYHPEAKTCAELSHPQLGP